jgi:hypothetical protein
MMMRALGLACLLLCCACGEDTPELTLQTPDRMRFDTEVYPVLLRDCAFSACHASGDRFFQVFGPGRVRLEQGINPLEPATPLELSHAYDRARSMIDATAPEESLLLRKPLASAAGGTGHEGVDDHGRNVYQSKMEPGWIVIHQWALGLPSVPIMPTQPQP